MLKVETQVHDHRDPKADESNLERQEEPTDIGHLAHLNPESRGNDQTDRQDVDGDMLEKVLDGPEKYVFP